MCWLLCEVAREVEERREQEADDEGADNQRELEDQEWRWSAEGLDIWCSDWQQLGDKQMQRLHGERDTYGSDDSKLSQGEALACESRDGVQVGLEEERSSDDFPACEVGPERKAVERGGVFDELKCNSDDGGEGSEASQLDPVAL